eukprot:446270_1
MIDYSGSKTIEEHSVSTHYSPSKSQSRYNEFYAKKKKQKLKKYQLKRSNTDKYLPPNLRSPTNEKNDNMTNNSDANIKNYSIALKSPNALNNERNNTIYIRPPDTSRTLPPNSARSNTYQEMNAFALQHSSQLYTSAEKEMALKRIVGAIASDDHIYPTGVLPIYQTDGFTYEQRTHCMILTGGCVLSAMVIFVAILAFMGYSG